jgi:PadR family transcriptional regulator PadR
VLRTLLFGPMHGHGIAKAIQTNSDDLLLVDHGSLYPALYRLVRKGLLAAQWAGTPRGRPMKFYRLTPAGAGSSPPKNRTGSSSVEPSASC